MNILHTVMNWHSNILIGENSMLTTINSKNCAEVCPSDAERQKKNLNSNRDGYLKKNCNLMK